MNAIEQAIEFANDVKTTLTIIRNEPCLIEQADELIAALQSMQGEAVGIAMACGNPDHTIATFNSDAVPVGAKLYTHPQSPAAVEELWCVRILGPDDVHAAPSKEIAEIGAEMHNRIFSELSERTGVLCRALVEPWPYDAESHAADAPDFVNQLILPAKQNDQDILTASGKGINNE